MIRALLKLCWQVRLSFGYIGCLYSANISNIICTGWENISKECDLPDPGVLQPLMDVLARPWIDHSGNLIHSVWTIYLRKAISVAMRHPGTFSSADLINQIILY